MSAISWYNLGFIFLSTCLASVSIVSFVFRLHSERDLDDAQGDSSPLPLCTEGVLNRKTLDFRHHQDPYWRMNKPSLKSHQCRLKFYSQGDFVSCLDSQQRSQDHQRLHFAFIGDSRIRQYYYNFLKFVPNYDYPWQDPADHRGKHVSRNISSPLLHHMIVSFFWQPGLDDEVFKLVSSWADDSATVPPHFLLIGITAHHMLTNLGDDHLKLAQGLVKLVAILERLKDRRRNGIKIIWLNQPPTIDWIFYKREFYVRSFSVHSEKMERYNQVIRESLRNSSHVIQVWDSSNYVVEEYVRSCAVAQRSAPQWIDTWMDCTDYIHPGYAAMTQTTQILLNDMCNTPLLSDDHAAEVHH